MKRILALFLMVAFTLWILPMGYFIKPSQEKLACDGERAICMCHVSFKSSLKDMEQGIALKAGASTAKESASAGNHFISTWPMPAAHLQSALLFENPYSFYVNPSLNSIEHVPL